jgi:hypothetical protein
VVRDRERDRQTDRVRGREIARKMGRDTDSEQEREMPELGGSLLSHPRPSHTQAGSSPLS